MRLAAGQIGCLDSIRVDLWRCRHSDLSSPRIHKSKSLAYLHARKYEVGELGNVISSHPRYLRMLEPLPFNPGSQVHT